jgi:nuclease S1
MQQRQSCSRSLVASLVVVFIFMLPWPTPAWAWGRLGHRVISRLAEAHMTPEAKAAVKALLAEGESLADASLWADEHRRDLPETAPWHYVDVPLDETQYRSSYSGNDPAKGCVVDKINEFRVVVKDKSQSIEKRRFALRFLIHCIEDLHMPMHVGENHDRGGNDTHIVFFDDDTNLHRLWDSGLIERTSDSEDYWLKDLSVLPSLQGPDSEAGGTVEDWATESLFTAREAYTDPTTHQRLKPGAKLSQSYLDKSLPVVRQRLRQAGLRLAAVLNEAFGDGP